MLSLLSKFVGFIYNVILYGCLMGAAMVGMVYFRQEGMLYHPNVPDERYRYPENMPPGYRNPKEYGMDYEDCHF